jgi:hypothetical protein
VAARAVEPLALLLVASTAGAVRLAVCVALAVPTAEARSWDALGQRVAVGARGAIGAPEGMGSPDGHRLCIHSQAVHTQADADEAWAAQRASGRQTE